MPASARVSAILLAAGESTRMGQQKALLPWQGATLLEYQLAQLAAVDEISEVIVVTGYEPDAINDIVARSPRARTAHNAHYKSGKVRSILTGLRAVASTSHAILLLSVDQPRSSAIQRAVIDRHIAWGSLITMPAYEGHRGHPVVFARALLPELQAINEESQGIRAVIRSHESEINMIAFDDVSVTLDINTPEDLKASR